MIIRLDNCRAKEKPQSKKKDKILKNKQDSLLFVGTILDSIPRFNKNRNVKRRLNIGKSALFLSPG